MDLTEYNRRRDLLSKRFKALTIGPQGMPETVWAALVMGDAIHIAVRPEPDAEWCLVKVVRAPQVPIETLFGITPNN